MAANTIVVTWDTLTVKCSRDPGTGILHYETDYRYPGLNFTGVQPDERFAMIGRAMNQTRAHLVRMEHMMKMLAALHELEVAK